MSFFYGKKESLAKSATDLVKKYRVKRLLVIDNILYYTLHAKVKELIKACASEGKTTCEILVSGLDHGTYASKDYKFTTEELVELTENVAKYLEDEEFTVEVGLKVGLVTATWADPVDEQPVLSENEEKADEVEEAEPEAEADEPEAEADDPEADEPEAEVEVTVPKKKKGLTYTDGKAIEEKTMQKYAQLNKELKEKLEQDNNE